MMKKLAAITALVALLLGGATATTDQPAEAKAKSSVSTVAPAPFTFTAYGDSHTTGNHIELQTGFDTGDTWILTAVSSRFRYKAGWARGGATTSDMFAHAEATAVSYLVMCASTNDPGAGLTWEQTRTNLIAIEAGVGPKRVLLVAIPPRDGQETRTALYNDNLEALATEQGWRWLDPWPTYRNAIGGWIPSKTVDGIHGTDAVYHELGHRIGNKLIDLTNPVTTTTTAKR